MKNLIYALFLLPAIGCLFGVQWKMERLQELEQTISVLQSQSLEVSSRQKKNDSCLAELTQADRSYLDKHLESLTLLETEMRRLQAVMQHQKESTHLARRLEFLKSGENRICLVEEKRRSDNKLQEIEEKLQHPVEMNEEDLKKLLVLIEGVSINPYSPIQGRPQLIFRDFDLTKQMAPSEEEVYVIDLKLIKREPI